MSDKERLDVLVARLGYCESRSKAKREIMAGNVFVDGQLSDKPGKSVSPESRIELRNDDRRYVSRGGRKLAHALEEFGIDVSGKKAVDVGASTGGFTDCLLQNGALQVWAVDVGKGQLEWKLRKDERVKVLEDLNARYLAFDDIGQLVDLVTVDVSFISLQLIIPAVKRVLKADGSLLCLVKPQFEAGPENVERGGVVKDPAVHLQVLEDTEEFSRSQGLILVGATYSPITGKSSQNIEYLFHLRNSSSLPRDEWDFPSLVKEAHQELD